MLYRLDAYMRSNRRVSSDHLIHWGHVFSGTWCQGFVKWTMTVDPASQITCIWCLTGLPRWVA